MRRTHLVGLFLWRTGLLVAGSYAFFRVARYALEYVDLPLQLDWGLALVLTGALLVAASFVLERLADVRGEEGLLD